MNIRLAKGQHFMFWCPDCQQSNGGGVINERFTIELHLSLPGCPTMKPCLWCGKGPMVMVDADLNQLQEQS